jgi:dihydroorotate dehydrogenase
MTVVGWLLHTAHDAARVRLKLAMAFARDAAPASGAVKAMGLTFSSRVGMAAGLDRYGTMAHLAHHIGLGFVEAGTVTPRPEPAHNRGLGKLLRNLERHGWSDTAARAGRAKLGISIARNSSTPPSEAWRDFVECMTRAWRFADYFTLNLGSLVPALAEDRGLLRSLLERIKGCRLALEFEHYRHVPIVVKLQLRDDMWEEMERLAECIVAVGFEGILAATEPNGASPEDPSRLLRRLARIVGDKAAIISVGEIRSPADALERLQAGATLIAIHRALLWPGPAVARGIAAASFAAA